MSDKKSIASVIKTLERAIGILETSSDVGEFPDVTRKRVIEMLNSATMDIYFINIEPDNKNKNNLYSHEPEKCFEPENHILHKEIQSVQTDDTHSVAGSGISQNNIDEDKFISEDDIESIVNETVAEESEFPVSKEETQIVDEDFIEENNYEERKADKFSDKPIFEWEEDASDTRDELNVLKHQLDEERKRLEQELQNWQAEKQKREDEMLAAKKLLEALQQQRQQVSQVIKQQSNWENEPIIDNRMINNPPVQRNAPPVNNPPVVNSVREEKPQEMLVDRFGTKKVLHENFETNVVNQISTPVSSLSKAIGINDRFRFIRELFGGDSDVYSETIKKLDKIGSLGNALSYIESSFSWDKNSDSVKQLISLVRRRYM